MKVLILGATGSLGRHLVEQALQRGHQVSVLARDPSRVVPRDPRIRIVQGDVLDPQALDRAVAGQDAVIYSIGAPNRRPTTLFSESTRLLIAAMEKHGVRRLVAVTGIGAGDSRGHGGFLYDKIIFPLLTRNIYRDKDRQEELIRNSKLEWVIVRPASFRDGRVRGQFRVETNLKGVILRRIPRAEVARFVLDQLTDDRYLYKTPLIGYE
jgi:putative NADH-flavin reductase